MLVIFGPGKVVLLCKIKQGLVFRIISAVGKPKLIDLTKCKAEIVIDVGVNRDENGKLCGDCYNFVDTGSGMKVTSVPCGIGLMTRAMLMRHVALVGNAKEMLEGEK